MNSSIFTNLVSSVNAAIETYIKPPLETFTINDQTLKRVKLLAEGGFSQVYLARDDQQHYFAVKRIPCKLGNEQLNLAQREVCIHQLFQHKNIVPLKNAAAVEEPDGSRTVYVVMPFYKRGTLQDIIDTYRVSGQHFKERQIYRLFLDVGQALLLLHTHSGPGIPISKMSRTHPSTGPHDDQSKKEGNGVAWAHRDIKPGNIMISNTGKPLLMDFGSAYPAKISITTKQQAGRQQDMAEEHSSMPYRAPELMHVKLDSVLDEKVDIWSLGCTLFAMAYGESPFEHFINKQGGGSLSLAVLNGHFTFPEPTSTGLSYSDDLKQLISWMLTLDPLERPSIHQVVTRLQTLLDNSPSEPSENKPVTNPVDPS